MKSIFYQASESLIPALVDQSTEGRMHSRLHSSLFVCYKLSLFSDSKCISIGCPIVDEILGGGLKMASGINELSGESGCGKTQFCLRLALTAQNPVSVGGIDKCM